ncbi:hypothetical protein GCM10009745_72510 [Kribbella yunnanensis]|uniref:histidine kinase n=1 Tax=Kribbella yunnanensis TaxID=190194 RepID=A0ABN2IY67_9ACTN
MKELLTGRRALRIDSAIAFAAMVSLQSRPHWQAGDWLWLRVILILFPLLIAIRRIEPALALPGLVVGAYLAVALGQAPWLLYVGIVLALWSLAGRCRQRTVIAVTAGSVLIPIVLDVARVAVAEILRPYDSFGGNLSQLFENIVAAGAPAVVPWPRVALIAVVAMAFLLVRRDRAHVVPARQRWADLRAYLVDPVDSWVRYALLAGALAGMTLVEVRTDLLYGGWWSAPSWMPWGVAAAALVLVFRRRPVVPVVVLTAASLIANWQSYTHYVPLYAALGVALYWLVVTPKKSRSLRWTLPVAIGVLILLPLITRVMRVRYLQLIFPEIKRRGWDYTWNTVLHNSTYDGIAQNIWPVTLSLILLLPVLAAIAVRQLRRNREAARREAELERAAEELEAEQVVLTERAIIARDLHDVVAHAVNLMVIQAETGPDLVRRGEADVLAGFQRIGDAGRRALSELDRLLSTLRDEDGIADPQLAPQPGISDLSQLVADVSDDHLPIELDLQGDLETPPEGQQVTAYRLVQEALTNVVKHARATGVRVAVRSEETGVRVEVTDDGVGFDVAAARRGNRHGLAGMRERVRIEGGTLDIRSTPGAGTTVDAWMPVGGRR